MLLPEAELPLDPDPLLLPPIIPQPLDSVSPATVSTVPSTFSIARLLVG
jgi:hypothetical protein